MIRLVMHLLPELVQIMHILSFEPFRSLKILRVL
jgi:hypothetical protein